MEEVFVNLDLEPMEGDEDPLLKEAIGEAEAESEEEEEDLSPIGMVNSVLKNASAAFNPWMAIVCCNGSMHLYACVVNPAVASVGLLASIELIRGCGAHFMNPPTDVNLERYKQLMYSALGSRAYMSHGAPYASATFKELFTKVGDIIKTNLPNAPYFLLYEEGHARRIITNTENDARFPVYILVRSVLKHATANAPYLDSTILAADVISITYVDDPLVTKFLAI